jgi:hypothetical protein
MDSLTGSLLLLACPLGMGLMMWMMMRGMPSHGSGDVPEATPAQKQELARLRAEVAELKAQSNESYR